MKTLSFIFMTIAMLLWFLSTLRRKPCQKKGCIDAIIPAYNEGPCLAQSLDNLLRNPYFCRVIALTTAPRTIPKRSWRKSNANGATALLPSRKKIPVRWCADEWPQLCHLRPGFFK